MILIQFWQVYKKLNQERRLYRNADTLFLMSGMVCTDEIYITPIHIHPHLYISSPMTTTTTTVNIVKHHMSQ